MQVEERIARLAADHGAEIVDRIVITEPLEGWKPADGPSAGHGPATTLAADYIRAVLARKDAPGEASPSPAGGPLFGAAAPGRTRSLATEHFEPAEHGQTTYIVVLRHGWPSRLRHAAASMNATVVVHERVGHLPATGTAN